MPRRSFPHGGAAEGAAEHAGEEWNTPGLNWTSTWERAQEAPQKVISSEKKKRVWAIVQHLRREQTLPEFGAVDITDGRLIRWWLWLPNLGNHSQEVIGVGVTRAWLSMRDNGNSAAFNFERTDGTCIQVLLVCRPFSTGQQLSIYV